LYPFAKNIFFKKINYFFLSSITDKTCLMKSRHYLPYTSTRVPPGVLLLVVLHVPFSFLYCLSVCALFVLLVFAQYCQYIWIVHSWWSLRFSLTFINISQLMPYARACSLHNRYPSHTNTWPLTFLSWYLVSIKSVG
jgi:hypothetical protein